MEAIAHPGKASLLRADTKGVLSICHRGQLAAFSTEKNDRIPVVREILWPVRCFPGG